MTEEKNRVFREFINSSYNDISVFLTDTKDNFSLTIEEIREYNRAKEFVKKIKANTQHVKNQHYVPQFYLKLFTNSDGKAETFDTDRKKIMKSQDTKSICSDTYFYALETGKADLVSQILEEFFKGYENRFAGIYESLINNILLYKNIEEKDLYELCIFVIVSFLRSKYFRNQLNDGHKKLVKKISSDIYKMHKVTNSIDPELQDIASSKEAEELLITGDYDLITDNEYHIEFMSDESKIRGFANCLFNKKIRIYISDGERNFITSDCCVVELFPERRTLYGVDFMSRFHYFALSPKILIEFFDPSGPGKKLKKERIGKTEVIYYNLIRTFYSKYLYSLSKDDFITKEYEEACILYIDRLATLFPSEFLQSKEKIDELKKHTKEFGLPYTNEYILKNVIPHLIQENNN